MLRKLFLFALLALSLSAFARTRSVAASHPATDAARGDVATISGIVHSVQGNLIRIADGLITIDATGAKVIIGRGQEATVAEIEPGMLVFAALRDVTTRSDGPLLATLITATPASDVTLTGVVENVNTTGRTLTLLRQIIHVNDDTSFGGFRTGEGTGLASIQRNQVVQVQADAINGRLVAREVLVLAPVLPEVGRVRGTVQSIGTESWTIRKENGENVTLVVNAQTKIAGSPKAGDTVEVLYRVDSANALVALSIIKFDPAPPPQFPIVHIHGNVKSIAATEWVVRENDTSDRTVKITEQTKIGPNIAVGDLVDILGRRRDDGTIEALTILRLRF